MQCVGADVVEEGSFDLFPAAASMRLHRVSAEIALDDYLSALLC